MHNIPITIYCVSAVVQCEIPGVAGRCQISKMSNSILTREGGGGYHMKVATLGTDTDNYSNYTLDKFHVRLP